MHASFTHLLHVEPEIFFGRLFFDAHYNAGLYERLGFARYEVLELRTLEDGRTRRSLCAEPPVSAPSIVKRQLDGRVHYTETGLFDPKTQRWTFESVPSILPEQVHIEGEIHLKPCPEGALHVCEMDIRVRAWGLGTVIERAIESNTRESYRINADYTNAYAREHGLLAPGAPI